MEMTYLSGSPEELKQAIAADPNIFISGFKRKVLRVYDDRITLQHTVITSGLNKVSKKRYYRLKNLGTIVYKVKEQKGRKFLFSYDVSKNGVREIPPFTYDARVSDAILNLCQNQIGDCPYDFSYSAKIIWYWKPLLVSPSGHTCPSFKTSQFKILKGISPRTSTRIDLAKKLLRGHYRKDLGKAVLNHNDLESVINFVSIPGIFDFFGVDTIVDFLNDSYPLSVALSYAPELARLCSMEIPRQHRRKLLMDRYIGFDTILLLTQLHDAGVEYSLKGSISEVHNRLSMQVLKIRDELNFVPFEYSEEFLNLVDLGFSLPETPDELRNLSAEYSNCSAGYIDLIRGGITVILTYPNYNAMLEIRDGNLKQCLGKYNKSLDSEHFWEICDKLLESGIIKDVPESCWGYKERETVAA